MIPIEFEEQKGYFLDDPTFDKTLYRLNDAKYCIVEQKFNRKEIARLNDDVIRITDERNEAQVNFREIQENQRMEREKFDRDRLQWNSNMQELQNKHLKTIQKVVIGALIFSTTTWALGRAGIL